MSKEKKTRIFISSRNKTSFIDSIDVETLNLEGILEDECEFANEELKKRTAPFDTPVSEEDLRKVVG